MERKIMKYNIRLFLDNGDKLCTQNCFASFKSEHVPLNGDLVYIGDEAIKNKRSLKIDTGIIYKVIQAVYCFNNYYDEDDLTEVEISVQKTDI